MLASLTTMWILNKKNSSLYVFCTAPKKYYDIHNKFRIHKMFNKHSNILEFEYVYKIPSYEAYF